jgi:hypothetical protein
LLYSERVRPKRFADFYNTVISIKFRDNADEFRVEIAGRFAGTVVDDVLYMWKTVLRDGNSRRFTIDITNLTGYDYAGCSLLTDMQKHGTHISAASALSLVFLSEISGPKRKFGPTLVHKKPSMEESEPRARREEPMLAYPLVSIASGE